MTRPADFLFALWDGSGAITPPLSVARELAARGHQVRVLGDDVIADEVRAVGAEHVGWATAPNRRDASPESQLVHDHDTRNPLTAVRRVLDVLACGPAATHAADTRAEIARRRPDVVVAADILCGVRIAAEAEGIALAGVASNPVAFPGWGVPPMGPGLRPLGGPLGAARDAVLGRVGERVWRPGLAPVNAARAAHGLEPVGSVIDQLLRVDRFLVLTSAAFEYDGWAPPAHVEITGPRLDDPAWAEAVDLPAGADPLVLIALSASYMGQENTLQRVASALEGLRVRALLTTGPSVPVDAIDPPANVRVVRSAAHNAVLPHAAAVVTHAGHGTLIKALAAGVPVLALPMGRDQLDNAARLVRSGAGLSLRPSVRPPRIAAAVRRLLDEPAFGEAASRLAASIAQETACDRAADIVEGLAYAGAGVPSPVPVPAP